jgi:hypothetical protein
LGHLRKIINPPKETGKASKSWWEASVKNTTITKTP